MRLLLDENLPKRLKQDFLAHEVFTIREKSWTGIKNGELLKLLLENNFDALLTLQDIVLAIFYRHRCPAEHLRQNSFNGNLSWFIKG